MAILKNYSDDLSGHKAWTKDTMDKSLNSAFLQLVGQFRTGKTMVWNNPKDIAPQDVMDAFGTDAAGLFRISAIIGNAINALLPGTVDVAPPAGYTVTINQDGTVLISGSPA